MDLAHTPGERHSRHWPKRPFAYGGCANWRYLRGERWSYAAANAAASASVRHGTRR
jgi:hypothetical protein